MVLAKKPFSKKRDPFPLTHTHTVTLYPELCDFGKMKRIRLHRGVSHSGRGCRLLTILGIMERGELPFKGGGKGFPDLCWAQAFPDPVSFSHSLILRVGVPPIFSDRKH